MMDHIQIKFKTLMIRSSLYDQSDAYTLVKVTITVPNTGTAAALNNRNKKVIFKNCGLFTDCISETSNKEIDHAKDIDVVMPRHNLIKYSEHYLKSSGSLWQYQRDEPFINDEDVTIDIPDDPDSASFKYKQKVTFQTGYAETKGVKIMVPLKYLSNFWNTLGVPLINCKINIILTWSKQCIKITGNYDDKEPKFAIIGTKIYVPVVTLSGHDNNAKLFQQLKAGFKEQLIGININQHQLYKHKTDI